MRRQPGGINDPVAQNIRAEQNRDAMPSPEDAKRERQKWLADQGCRDCDEDNPDNLGEMAPYGHTCSGVQSPPMHPVVICKDCRPDDRREAYIQNRLDDYRDDPEIVGVAIYECDIVEPIEQAEPETTEIEEQVGWDDDGEPVMETIEIETYRRPPVPDVPIKHVRCGSRLDEICLFEDEAE